MHMDLPAGSSRMTVLRPSDRAGTELHRLRFREFLHLVGGFWRVEGTAHPWLLTFGVIAIAVLEIVIQVAINEWNGWFFDILSGRRTGQLSSAVLVFIGLAFAAIAAGATGVLCRLLLQVRWRRWLTSEMLDHWLADRRYLRLVSIGDDSNNPEYRIAEDVRLSTEPVTDFITGLIGAMLTSAAFLGLLWSLGGGIGLYGIYIPGYMVFAVLIYAAVAWSLTILVGGSYVAVVKDRNEAEAKLRYELIHLR
jgi:putative ATP-binding cassette transporter